MSDRARATLLAILAAALYAAMAPVSKLLQVSVPPVLSAGLLYLGAGMGMAAIMLVEKACGKTPDSPSLGRSDLRFVVAMVVLDMSAPICLMLGLSTTSPQTVSLLNNFEIVATTVIAAALFHERVSRTLSWAIAVITCACALLSFDGAERLSLSAGALLVLAACMCWGFENNCTASLSSKDVRQVVLVKGLGSGAGSLAVSSFAGEGAAAPSSCVAMMALGFLSVGLSVYCYVIAQASLGAARTSAFYATSPFIGAFLGMLLFREMPGPLFWVAFALMACGVGLSARDAIGEESPSGSTQPAS